MRYDYVVTLRRGNDRGINGISLGVCLLSLLAFCWIQFHTEQPNVYLLFAILILTGGILFNLFRKKHSVYRQLLFLCGVFWLGVPGWRWVSVFFFIMGFLEYQAKHPLEIGFTMEKVVINSLFRRSHVWTDLSNVVLKDGLLTLDFKNNRLFQKEVLDDDEPDADEDEFNAWCRERLRDSFSVSRKAAEG